jgi:hypothetical protein
MLPVRVIPLSRGKFALVDPEDFPAVSALNPWFAERSGPGRWYAARNARREDGRRKLLRLHVFLTGFRLTDHINQNGLDNRRSNLRDASPAINMRNVRPRSTNYSGHVGVSYCRQTGLWKARVGWSGGEKWLGRFRTPEEANSARRAFLEAHGEAVYQGRLPQRLDDEPRAPRPRLTDEDRARISLLRAAGISQREIARMVGRNRATVRAVITTPPDRPFRPPFRPRTESDDS